MEDGLWSTITSAPKSNGLTAIPATVPVVVFRNALLDVMFSGKIIMTDVLTGWDFDIWGGRVVRYSVWDMMETWILEFICSYAVFESLQIFIIKALEISSKSVFLFKKVYKILFFQIFSELKYFFEK